MIAVKTSFVVGEDRESIEDIPLIPFVVYCEREEDTVGQVLANLLFTVAAFNVKMESSTTEEHIAEFERLKEKYLK